MLSTQLWGAFNCIPQDFCSVIPFRLKAQPSAPLKMSHINWCCLILSVMPVSPGVCLSAYRTGFTLSTRLRRSLLCQTVKRESLNSYPPKPSERLSPEEWGQLFLCTLSLLAFFPSFAFSSVYLSPAG